MRNIRTEREDLCCGSKEFRFLGYDGDGMVSAWALGCCLKCKAYVEFDTSSKSWEFYLTPEQEEELVESVLNNLRASFALEGKKISDANFAKLKELCKDLEEVI